jgi:3-dehydroquinate dehydratase type I
MTVPRRFKVPSAEPRSVAVVASEADLLSALRLRRTPGAFELRLDALERVVSADDPRLGRLAAPLIIAARHPAEGGIGNLSASARRQLLRATLPRAAYVDVELRSAQALRTVLQSAAARRVRRIISVHALERAPLLAQMQRWLDAARALTPAIFKIAVRADTPAELERLLQFFELAKRVLPVSAMGIGKLGRRSRIELARRGSVLNYAHLGTPAIAGQLSLAEVRRLVASEVAPSPHRG